MNKYQTSTKILIMHHYLIFCKLTFDLHINIKLHTLNKNYIKNIFQNFLKLYFEIKFCVFICAKRNLHHT